MESSLFQANRGVIVFFSDFFLPLSLVSFRFEYICTEGQAIFDGFMSNKSSRNYAINHHEFYYDFDLRTGYNTRAQLFGLVLTHVVHTSLYL